MTSDFDRDFAARLHTVLDAEAGPDPTWADAPAARTVALRRRPRIGPMRVLAVAAVLLIGGAVAGAVLVGQPRPAHGPAANGWIAYSDDQIHVVREGMASKSIIGRVDDTFVDDCPTFSPDGTKLAYTELDLRFVEPTEAPQPSFAEGEATPEPTERATPYPTPEPGASMMRLLVVPVDGDGRPSSAPIQVATGDDLSCPRWSPDGSRLAAISNASALFVVDLAGAVSPLGPDLAHPDLSGHTDFDWSPDGTTIAVSDTESSWLVPTNGAAPRQLPKKAWLMRWAPDGRHLAADIGSDVVLLDPDGTVTATLVDRTSEGPASPWAWAPDGTRIAYVDGTDVVTVSTDGARRTSRPIVGGDDVVHNAWIAGWSPMGDRILVAVTTSDVERSPMSLFSIPVDPQATPATVLGPGDAYFGGGTSWQARFD